MSSLSVCLFLLCSSHSFDRPTPLRRLIADQLESDLDRGHYLAKVYAALVVQLGIVAAASFLLPSKAPAELRP